MPNVVYTVEERVKMVLQYSQGLSSRRISDHFAAAYPNRPIPNKSTILRIVKQFHDEGNVHPANKNKTRYPSRSLSAEKKLNIFLAVVEAEGRTSLSRIAQEQGVAISTVHKILKSEHYKAYKMQEHQELKLKDYEQRMIFCERMMNIINKDPGLLERICFSDERTMELVDTPNRQNNRIWAQEPPIEAPIETGTQWPQKVNVWLGMVGDRLVGPYFIDGNLNGEKYLRLLQDQIVPAIREIEGGGPNIWFQQNGSPPHVTLAVRAYLNKEFPQRWIGRGGPVQWAPRSPDLTPLDYSLWSFLKNRVYADGTMANLETLRNRITEVLASLDPEMIQKMINDFYNRVGYRSAAEGGHFERILRRRIN